MTTTLPPFDILTEAAQVAHQTAVRPAYLDVAESLLPYGDAVSDLATAADELSRAARSLALVCQAIGQDRVGPDVSTDALVGSFLHVYGLALTRMDWSLGRVFATAEPAADAMERAAQEFGR